MFDLDLTQYVIDLIYQSVPGVRREGDKLHFSCPLCDDRKVKKRRGWYYIKTNSFFCWNAGCPANSGATSPYRWLSLLLGKPEIQVRADLIKRASSVSSLALSSKIKASSFFDDKEEKSQKPKEENDWTEELPDVARQLLESRKIFKAPYLDGIKFYYDKKTQRLVIPWTEDYWQERALFKSQEIEEGKYLFPANKQTKKPVFGLKSADLSGKMIYVLEGLFDSIFVKGGLASGSITMSKHQKQILKEIKGQHQIVLLMDNQWRDKTSLEQSLKIARSMPFQKIFIWPESMKKWKDVNQSVIDDQTNIALWSSDQFLESNVMNGVRALMKCQQIKASLV